MFNPYNTYNTQSFINPMYPMQLSQPVAQPSQSTIQTVQQQNPSVSCFFVNDKSELKDMNISFGTVYIGINKKTKEVYMRSWNNDGNIDFDTYTLSEGNKEVSEMQAIMNKLNAIEEKINERNASNDNATVYERSNAKQSDDGSSQPNVTRKRSSTAVSDAFELR